MKEMDLGHRLNYTFDEYKYTFVCIGKEYGRMLFISNECMGISEFGKDNRWKTSTVRAYLYSEFYSDLSVVLEDEWITENDDELFLLSKEEYQEYRENIRRFTKLVDDDSAVFWWLRSPYVSNTHYAYCVDTDGSIYDSYVGYGYGVAPAFWVRVDT